MWSVLAVHTVMIIKLSPQLFVGRPAISTLQPLTWWVNNGRSFVEVIWPQCEGEHSPVSGANVLPHTASQHGAQLSIGTALPFTLNGQ